MGEEKELEKTNKGWIDQSIDFIFSNDERKWLILVFILGTALRWINVSNRHVFGDPPHFIIQAINFLNSGLLVTWDQSAFLWYPLTDIFYMIFGVTQFASRFSSFLFGSLTIILIYLFVSEFSGNKKLALLSAVFYSFAPTFLFNTADEQDMSVLFFIFLTFYLLIRGLKNNSKGMLIFSAIFFGIASMWKVYVPILIVPYAGFLIYYNYNKKFAIKKNLKTLAIMGIAILLAISPVMVYNYSNYKHNNVTTFFFVKFFKALDNPKIDSLYGWVSGGELHREGSFFYTLFVNSDPGNPNAHSNLYMGLTYSLYTNGPILGFLAIIGMLFMAYRYKKEEFAREYLIFFLLYLIIPFLFIANSNYMSKHFFHFIAFSIPVTAYLLMNVYGKLPSSLRDFVSKRKVYIFFILSLLYIFLILSRPFNQEMFFSQNPEGKFIKYKLESIPEQSLIIYDARIYNSLAGWLFNDRYFISTSDLNQFISANRDSPNKVTVPVYIVECVIDDCGWGTISQNQPLNQSMEDFFSGIKNQSKPEKIIKSQFMDLKFYNPLISRQKPEDYLAIYKLSMDVDINLLKQIKSQYNYFLYPLRYENKLDSTFANFIYSPRGLFEVSINKIAWFAFYAEIILSFLAIPLVFFWLYKENYSNVQHNQK